MQLAYVIKATCIQHTVDSDFIQPEKHAHTQISIKKRKLCGRSERMREKGRELKGENHKKGKNLDKMIEKKDERKK